MRVVSSAVRAMTSRIEMEPNGSYEAVVEGNEGESIGLLETQWLPRCAAALQFQQARGGGVFVVWHPPDQNN